jgi:hypothetical protein
LLCYALRACHQRGAQTRNRVSFQVCHKLVCGMRLLRLRGPRGKFMLLGTSWTHATVMLFSSAREGHHRRSIPSLHVTRDWFQMRKGWLRWREGDTNMNAPLLDFLTHATMTSSRICFVSVMSPSRVCFVYEGRDLATAVKSRLSRLCSLLS